MIQIIAGALIAAALFTGGYFTGRASKPDVVNEYYDVDNVQTTRVETENVTRVFQGQVTAVVHDGKELRFMNVNLDGATNVTLTLESNFSRLAVTNGITNNGR